eukprot:scaffold4274_cov376-Prasinococcus_capsulatus_cf.AAC.6
MSARLGSHGPGEHSLQLAQSCCRPRIGQGRPCELHVAAGGSFQGAARPCIEGSQALVMRAVHWPGGARQLRRRRGLASRRIAPCPPCQRRDSAPSVLLVPSYL